MSLVEKSILASQSEPKSPIVTLLEQVLQGAKEGKISSIVCITISPRGAIESPACGMQMAEMSVGLDIAKKNLIEVITRPAQILRPG